MIRSPLVSAICTAKNAELTIEAVINSVLAQTLTDWEMVVVDDGSSDATMEIAAGLGELDNRVVVIPTKGVGRGAALNLGVSSSRGRFLAIVDADDPCHSRRFELELKAFTPDGNLSLISSRALYIEKLQSIAWPQIGEPIVVEDVTLLLRDRNPVIHSSVMMSREAFDSVGGYDASRLSQYDYDLWIRLAERGYQLGRTEETLVAKLIHENQSFESRNHTRYVLRSLSLQLRAMRTLGFTIQGLMHMPARFVWGFLPQKTRVLLSPLYDLSSKPNE